MSFLVVAAQEAFDKNQVWHAESIVDQINSRQKFSNISLIIGIAGAAFALLAAALQSLIILLISAPALLWGVIVISIIHIKEVPEYLKAIEILNQIPNVKVEGGGKTLGLYLNAYSRTQP